MKKSPPKIDPRPVIGRKPSDYKIDTSKVRISLLCPTRNREKGMRRFCDSAIAKAANPELVEVVWYIDDDDKVSPVVYEDLKKKYGDKIKAIIGPRHTFLNDSYNATLAGVTGDILFIGSDDLEFCSSAWDHHVIWFFDYLLPDVFNATDKIGFFFVCKPPPQGGTPVPTFQYCFFHKNLTDVIGYISPPGYDHCDTYLRAMGKGARGITPEAVRPKIKYGPRIRKIDGVLIEHHHPHAKKAEKDQTYYELYDRRRKYKTSAAYFWDNDYVRAREMDIDKLNVWIKEFHEKGGDP